MRLGLHHKLAVVLIGAAPLPSCGTSERPGATVPATPSAPPATAEWLETVNERITAESNAIHRVGDRWRASVSGVSVE